MVVRLFLMNRGRLLSSQATFRFARDVYELAVRQDPAFHPPRRVDASFVQLSSQRVTRSSPVRHSWFSQPELLDPRATALDQDDQHDHKQSAGYNSNNARSVHVEISLLEVI